jgi:hypothetical protein
MNPVEPANDQFGITICPQPPLNFVKRDEYMKANRLAAAVGVLLESYNNLYVMTLGNMNDVAFNNLTWEAYFDSLAQPLWLHQFDCEISTPSGHKSGDCSFPPSASSMQTRPSDLLNSSNNVFHQTAVGTWETRLLLDEQRTTSTLGTISVLLRFSICSLFRPNTTLEAGEEFKLKFNKSLASEYPESHRAKLCDATHRPGYQIYVHNPQEALSVLPYDRPAAATMIHVQPGERVNVGISAEDLVMLSTEDKPCDENPEAIVRISQVRFNNR